MSLSDGGLRALFRQNLVAGWHWQSVEMGMRASGVPDSNYCFSERLSRPGIEGWIEFKQTHGFTPSVRPGQVAWIERRLRCGGRAFVATRRWCDAGARREEADELWLVAGAGVRHLKDAGLLGMPAALLLGCWRGGPARWDWPAVAAVLRAP